MDAHLIGALPPVCVARPAGHDLRGDAPPYFGGDGGMEVAVDSTSASGASPSRNTVSKRAKDRGGARVRPAVRDPDDREVVDVLALKGRKVRLIISQFPQVHGIRTIDARMLCVG